MACQTTSAPCMHKLFWSCGFKYPKVRPVIVVSGIHPPQTTELHPIGAYYMYTSSGHWFMYHTRWQVKIASVCLFWLCVCVYFCNHLQNICKINAYKTTPHCTSLVHLYMSCTLMTLSPFQKMFIYKIFTCTP